MPNDKDKYHISQWYRFDADSPERFGLKILVNKYGLVAEAMINRIDSRLRKTPGYKLPFDDMTLQNFAIDWQISIEKVKEFMADAIANHELSRNGDSFYSDRINYDMGWMAASIEHKRLAGIKGAEARWGHTEPKELPSTSNLENDVQELVDVLKSKPSKAYMIDYLKRTIWPQAGLPEMDSATFGCISQALQDVKLEIVAEAVIKFTKYGAGKKKPANYFKAVLEDKRETK